MASLRWSDKSELGFNLGPLDPWDILISLGDGLCTLSQSLDVLCCRLFTAQGHRTKGIRHGSHVSCARAGLLPPRGCIQSPSGTVSFRGQLLSVSSCLRPVGLCPFGPYLIVRCLEATWGLFIERPECSPVDGGDTLGCHVSSPGSFLRQGICDTGSGRSSFIDDVSVPAYSGTQIWHIWESWPVLLTLPHVHPALDHSLQRRPIEREKVSPRPLSESTKQRVPFQPITGHHSHRALSPPLPWLFVPGPSASAASRWLL